MTERTEFVFTEDPHRRFNPLQDEWVLCSPHRARRPWLGQKEDLPPDTRPQYDPKCFLCPGNARSSGAVSNPVYKDTFVFTNDFPAVKMEQPDYKPNDLSELVKMNDKLSSIFKVEAVKGTCRVVCFSPRHDQTLAEMNVPEIEKVIDVWCSQYHDYQNVDLGNGTGKPVGVRHVQIFENKGAMMGCSAPHPHGQIWGTDVIPSEPAKELLSLKKYKSQHGTCMLCDYTSAEVGSKGLELNGEPQDRIVYQNDSFVSVVPFWAVWPYEVLVSSRRHVGRLVDLTAKEKTDLADVLRIVTCKYDNVFECPFPYSMGLHQSPLPLRSTEPDETQELAHLHIHFYPPLLRSATVRKFLVGFEMLGESQRDLTPEQAANRLRLCNDVHYKQRV
jgi:UDPglucose--hexose-1-phosphate uridylyltransferase